ncbi:MAG: G5 domain-containing protein, partial [Oscillospiraceae bacterium]
IIMICLSMNTVVINDGQNSFTFKTLLHSPESILDAAGVDYADDDLVLMDKSNAFPVVTLMRAFDVTVTLGSETATVRLASGTVGEAIQKAGFLHNEHDLINYDTAASVYSGMEIDVVSVDYLYETSHEALPHSEQVVYSNDMIKGSVDVADGEDGLKMVTYRKKLVNGIITETTVISEEIVKDAVDKTKTVGTKTPVSQYNSDMISCISQLSPSSPIALDANGKPLNYSKVITGNATAYSGDGSTSTGVKPRPGYIAVNPRQIPYGTKMYIVSSDGRYNYGYAIAADTGGFVNYTGSKATVADLFFNTSAECRSFGRRQVQIYIID